MGEGIKTDNFNPSDEELDKIRELARSSVSRQAVDEVLREELAELAEHRQLQAEIAARQDAGAERQNNA